MGHGRADRLGGWPDVGSLVSRTTISCRFSGQGAAAVIDRVVAGEGPLRLPLGSGSHAYAEV
ncbi:hypothetical protein [Streptomyces sp. NPDC056628]|uniref:hypothetical protein n=1 Tax=Streptomyces sp. NPDC056628 TaxID=3345882 RepID=UPI0036B04778